MMVRLAHDQGCNLVGRGDRQCVAIQVSRNEPSEVGVEEGRTHLTFEFSSGRVPKSVHRVRQGTTNCRKGQLIETIFLVDFGSRTSPSPMPRTGSRTQNFEDDLSEAREDEKLAPRDVVDVCENYHPRIRAFNRYQRVIHMFSLFIRH